MSLTKERGQARDDIRASQRGRLTEIMDQTGMSASELSTAAGLADNTITRFLNKRGYKGVLSPLTINAIEAAAKSRGAKEVGDEMKEASQYVPAGKTPFDQAIAALLREYADSYAMILHKSEIDARGYHSGDVLIVVQLKVPLRPRDVVLAEVGPEREKIFRIYEPPVLTGATLNPLLSPRPLVIDEHTVRIVGTVPYMLRRDGPPAALRFT